MKTPLLLSTLIGLMACQHENDIQPTTSSLAGELAGTYHTNVYLDPSSVAISSSQLPVVELKAESDSQVTLFYTKRYPIPVTQSFEHILVRQQADGIQLLTAGSGIGTLQTDRVFTSNGMEKQDKLLRISIQSNAQTSINFAGLKP